MNLQKETELDRYLNFATESPGDDVWVGGRSVEAGGGGDCFYHSLASQCEALGRKSCSKSPASLRREIGEFMRTEKTQFEPWVDFEYGRGFENYLSEVEHSKKWATYTEAVAAAQLYKLNIVMV